MAYFGNWNFRDFFALSGGFFQLSEREFQMAQVVRWRGNSGLGLLRPVVNKLCRS